MMEITADYISSPGEDECMHLILFLHISEVAASLDLEGSFLIYTRDYDDEPSQLQFTY